MGSKSLDFRMRSVPACLYSEENVPVGLRGVFVGEVRPKD